MSNEEVIKGLKPEALWRYFAEICEVPHCSHHLDAVLSRMVELSEKLNLKVKRDKISNICAEIPATPGYEKAPGAILQGHIDMVCEKNSDKKFDFQKDAIQMMRDGDWMTADGTSLGADNGIGVAAGFAIAEEKDAVHGPLEILITVNEETGMDGAIAIDPSIVNGRILLNLDSEEIGEICIGCAGGSGAKVSLPLEWAALEPGESCFEVKVDGLLGGHSGTEIHLGRGSALKFLGRLLKDGGKFGLRLIELESGNKHNAIPRESHAVLAFDAKYLNEFKALIEAKKKVFLTELDAGHNLEITVKETDKREEAATREASVKALNLIVAAPNGVMGISSSIPGFVETSATVAITKIEDGKLGFLSSMRSSVDSGLDNVVNMYMALGEAFGATVEITDSYPGWQPNMNSAILKVLKETSKEVFGYDPKIGGIHAGLECGILGARIEGLDMISFGPQIENPHSPDEKVHIESVEQFYKLLKVTLKKIAEG